MNSQSENTIVLIAIDVPTWLTSYGENLNWSKQEVVDTTRRVVDDYLSKLPQKRGDYDARRYAGSIPQNFVAKISTVDWSNVSSLTQTVLQKLLRNI